MLCTRLKRAWRESQFVVARRGGISKISWTEAREGSPPELSQVSIRSRGPSRLRYLCGNATMPHDRTLQPQIDGINGREVNYG